MEHLSQTVARAVKRDILRRARDVAARMRQQRNMELARQPAANEPNAAAAARAARRWTPAPWDAD